MTAAFSGDIAFIKADCLSHFFNSELNNDQNKSPFNPTGIEKIKLIIKLHMVEAFSKSW
jgi:hypothetical protein